jgi:type 1 glutamine amidotransferase
VRTKVWASAAVVISTVFLGPSCTQTPQPYPGAHPLRVLLYSKETEWFHRSNETAREVLTREGEARGWRVVHTKDASYFRLEYLKQFDVVVFSLTSGRTLSDAERSAFRRYIQEGGNVAGVHSASHTDYDWPYFVELMGGTFVTHPPVAEGTLVLEAADALTDSLPKRWTRTDEFYSIDRSADTSPYTKLLMSLDVLPQATSPALPAGRYPISWTRLPTQGSLQGTRVFYTALGHTEESYRERSFVDFVLGGIAWAGESQRLRRSVNE